MQFVETAISSVYLIKPRKIGDSRGYFCETFRQDKFCEILGNVLLVQDNQSLSADVGTIRGLHFQQNPRAQGKLVRCIAGTILDVAVDIRIGSPTYGKHVKVELSASNGYQLWVPPGFAHGFCTLESNSIISYKVSEYYSPDHDRGLLWNDPKLGIEWPIDAANAILSAKDRVQPALADVETNFFMMLD
ncbi:dTDP-4-dehydrorhamnose 3,5-epimerase [Rhizobium soli]|uniref:dTDP-4-dehydrorhamnose 3,5-epimerase n=1 Tax=Rhizobium soli TaxID=424798 RepID=A0A7X0JQQ0_9HYPH|nr:dTDP-4-dehydrorhamnose 3,5-epimerase [Rhizobium soli]MBB6511132.1 dTDP-4-dehydrorhamnose 3,5-epimerase [Rhizobium soli]